MRRSLIISILFLMAMVSFPAISADLREGLDAYQKADYATALEALEPLAEKGDPQAQFTLASMYEYGHGVPKNEPEAARWFFVSATQGNIEAAKKLSEIIARSPEIMRQLSGASDRVELRQDTEGQMARNIEELLEKTVGPQNVRAKVSAVLDHNGVIKRVTASILIDGRVFENDKGEFVYQPRAIEELELLEGLARGVIGYDKDRGDSIDIVNMEFSDPPELMGAPIDLFLGLNKNELLKFAEMLVLSVVTFLVVILVGAPLIFILVLPIVYILGRWDEKEADSLGLLPFSLGSLSYFPIWGIIFGAVGVFWGGRSDKKRGRLLALVCMGGIVFNVAMFALSMMVKSIVL